MKKVLIISYFYPPANFAGSYRVAAWAKHLKKLGHEVVVITRHWEENCTDYSAINDKSESCEIDSNGVKIYRLPYKGTFRDRIVEKYSGLKGFAKIFSVFNLIFSNYFIRLNPSYNLYKKAEEIVEKEGINWVLTSGRPFFQFQFLVRLKNKFPKIRTLGDYRDPWNTNTNISSSLKRKFLKLLETPLERKLTKQIDILTTCSEGFSKSISSLSINRAVHIITNGFEKFHYNEMLTNNGYIEIAYIGSLYKNQRIELFLNSINQLVKHNKEFKLIFYGLSNQSDALKRIKLNLKSGKLDFEVKPWMRKTEMINAAMKHDCFLICGIPSRKGTYTAKFFDYLSFQKNIILCPSDNDILEKEIKRLNIGVVLKNENEIKNWYEDLSNNNFVWDYEGNIDEIAEFKYENQVKKLNSIIENFDHET